MKPADLAIPKVIHQTWKSAELEQPFKSFQASWRLHHPEWEYRFWTDQDLDVLVQTHAPGLLQLYRDYPDPICRIDLARHPEGREWQATDESPYSELRVVDRLPSAVVVVDRLPVVRSESLS